MALSLPIKTNEVIDLAEFRRRVRIKVDPNRPDTLMHAAEDLVALSNDRDLLARLISDDLRQWPMAEPRMYTPQSYLLDTFDEFSVRINLWKAQGLTGAEKTYFSYLSYHNHDFPFITTNYYGPGYSTSIYEAVADWLQAGPGDTVDLCFLEETTLPPGKVMYYRKWLDVHSQIPPLADSASINLLMDNKSDLYRNQFYFDIDSNKISGRVENIVSKRLTALDLGRFLGGVDSIPLLSELLHSTKCTATSIKSAQIIEWLNSSEKA